MNTPHEDYAHAWAVLNGLSEDPGQIAAIIDALSVEDLLRLIAVKQG